MLNVLNYLREDRGLENAMYRHPEATQTFNDILDDTERLSNEVERLTKRLNVLLQKIQYG